MIQEHVGVSQWQLELNSTNRFFKTHYLQLQGDFMIQVTYTLDKNLEILKALGFLTYRNGAFVNVSIGHQDVLNKNFNGLDQEGFKIIFSIDHFKSAIFFVHKQAGVTKQDESDHQIQAIQKKILKNQKKMLIMMGFLGLPVEENVQLMKKLLRFKKDLKNNFRRCLEGVYVPNKKNQTASHIASTTAQEIQIQKQKLYLNDRQNVFILDQKNGIKIDKLNKSKNQMQQESTEQYFKVTQGGYFALQQGKYLFTDQNGHRQVKLALKALKARRNNDNYTFKLQKQKEIVEKIKDKKYLLNYYYNSNEDIKCVLMQAFEHSLQEYVYYFGDSLSLKDKINISKQVVQATMDLHASGVVHRDIKPTNFLVDDSNQKDIKIKIIDFAESYSASVDHQGSYACSYPYSPLECRKKDYQTQAQIDIWSVGMTIYQIFFRKLPVSFSRAFLSDIMSGWGKEMLLSIDQREKHGIALVDQIIAIMCVKAIKTNPQERIKLSTMLSILCCLQGYVDKLLTLFE